MSSILIVARAELRRRSAGLVVLGLIGGIVGAAVVGALGAARRTATAYPRLARATALDDARLFVFRPGLAERIAALGWVKKAWIGTGSVAQVEAEHVEYDFVLSGPERARDLLRGVLVSGRRARADSPAEVVMSEAYGERTGRKLGDELKMKFLTAEELRQFDTGFGEPDGPHLTLRIVGVVRLAGEEGAVSGLEGTPALERALQEGGAAASHVMFVRLRGGNGAFAGFRDDVEKLAEQFPRAEGEDFQPYELIDPAGGVLAVSGASRVLVGGLLAFAAVALLAGGFVVAQVVARAHALVQEEQRIEQVLGMTRAERAFGRTLAAVPAAVIASAIAVAGAVLSTLATPGGTIARFEPSPGLEINAAVLGLGALGVVVAMLLVEFGAALRFGRRRSSDTDGRRSPVAERGGAFGSRAPTVVGLRFAFERGPRRSAVPVRSALIGAAVGVAGVVAVFGFASSLHRLINTPERYGWQADFLVADLMPDSRARLERDPRVGSLSLSSAATARLASGEQVSAIAFTPVRGSIAWSMLAGRMPDTRDEIAVGPRFARRLSLGIGERLKFSVPGSTNTRTLRITGIGFGPPLNNQAFGDEVALDAQTLRELAQTEPFTEGFVKAAPGVDADAFARELGEDLELTRAELPVAVDNLRQLGALPTLLGAFLAFIGAAAITNALIVGVRRRRRELAVLRVLGFVRRQIGASVRTASLATAVVGIVLGVPAGLLIGANVWRAVASSAYVAEDAAVPAMTLAIIAPAVLALALVVALVPSRRAARVHPAQVLHAE